jgi:hypothetical protein
MERSMVAELLAIVDIVERFVPSAQLAELVERARIERVDAGEGDEVLALMDALRPRVGGVVNRRDVQRVLRRLGERVSQFNQEQLLRQIEAAGLTASLARTSR